MKVRKDIMPHVRKNSSKNHSTYTEMMAQYHMDGAQGESSSKKLVDTMDNIIDIR